MEDVDQFSEELLMSEPPPVLDDGFDTIVVVDNLPQAEAAKVEKLTGAIKKFFQKKMDAPDSVKDVYLCQDESKACTGFGFVEFHTPQLAKKAVADVSGKPLDKDHVLSVTLLSAFDQIVNTPEEWVEPPPEDFSEQDDLSWWLLNPDCDDQYAVRQQGDTMVYNNKWAQPTLVENRTRWTDTCVAWSPKGSYLATFHGPGIALWGGPEWKRMAKFGHHRVKLIDFSPDERYLVTFSDEAPDPIIIWDIKTGQAKRKFKAPPQPYWPLFKWSHDDKYFAAQAPDQIRIYETSTFKLLDQKPLKVKQVVDFQWSPSDNYIAYWVPEDGEKPANVSIMRIPDREKLTVRNLFSVKECTIKWQEAGTYLCVQVDRYTKSKKQVYTNFELFNVKEKLIPCSSLEFEKTKISAFAWEPCGDKFAIIHGESPRICVSFYQLQPGKIAKLETFDRLQVNSIFWSPKGQYCVVAGLYNPSAPNSMTGQLTYIDTVADGCSIATATEHMYATDCQWDPTGRFVLSSVSHWVHQSDNGYWLWSFQGRLLQKHNLDKFYQVVWRPRPPSLLTKKEIEEGITDDWKKWQARFKAEDFKMASGIDEEERERRNKLLSDWNAYRSKRNQNVQEWAPVLLKKRPAPSSADTDETVEETVEFFVKEEVEEVDPSDLA